MPLVKDADGSPAFATDMTLYQRAVARWISECFQPEVATDRVERADRFIEEALELVQAGGYTAERAHALVDYVFGRPAGDPPQEVGGTMVCLAALCNCIGVDLSDAALTELDRIEQPSVMEKIRRKHASKPRGSALPGSAA